MALSEEAKLYIKKAFGDEQELEKTDPEFYEFFSNFAYGEVRGVLSLDEKPRICRSLRCYSAAAGLTNSAKPCPPL